MCIFKRNMFFLSSIKSFIIFILYSYKIISQELPSNSSKSEIDLYNHYLSKYNETIIHFVEISLKLKKRVFSLDIQNNFRELKRLKRVINSQISNIRIHINNNQSINSSEDLNNLKNNLDKFDEKYNEINELYIQYKERIKIIKKFLIDFFIGVIIILLIIIIIILIISFFVIKRQKKYYILKEEITFNQIKDTNNSNNSVNERDNKRIKINNKNKHNNKNKENKKEKEKNIISTGRLFLKKAMK